MNENMSFKELYAIVRHRFVLILLITIGVTLIMGFVQFKVISPTYQASTQVLVHESDGEENSISVTSSEIFSIAARSNRL